VGGGRGEGADRANLLFVGAQGARRIHRLRQRIGHAQHGPDRDAATDADAGEGAHAQASWSVVRISVRRSSTSSAFSPSARSVTLSPCSMPSEMTPRMLAALSVLSPLVS